MSLLTEAFNIPINSANREFVTHPYIPFPSLTYPIPIDPNGDGQANVSVSPRPMTIGRCFDVQYGAKDCFMPSYPRDRCNSCGSDRVYF